MPHKLQTKSSMWVMCIVKVHAVDAAQLTAAWRGAASRHRAAQQSRGDPLAGPRCPAACLTAKPDWSGRAGPPLLRVTLLPHRPAAAAAEWRDSVAGSRIAPALGGRCRACRLEQPVVPQRPRREEQQQEQHAVARERRGGLPGGVRRAAAVPVVAAVPGRQRGLRQGLEAVLVVRQHGQHPERLDGARSAAGPGPGHSAAAAQGPRAVAAARARAAAPGGLGAGRAAGAKRRRHPAARQRPLLVPGPRRLHGALLGGDGGAARQRGRHRRQRPRALLGEEAADAGADVQRQPAALRAAGAAGRGRLQVLALARRHPSLQLRARLPSTYRPPVRSEAGMDDALPLFGDLESPPLRHL